MTQQEKRVKIAERMGWKRSEHLDYTLYGTTRRNENLQFPNREPAYEKEGRVCRAEQLPNYFEDLNACHAFSQVLDEMDRTCPISEVGYRFRYGNRLVKATNLSNPFDASAAIRAEEFGLTLGLWKEERE